MSDYLPSALTYLGSMAFWCEFDSWELWEYNDTSAQGRILWLKEGSANSLEDRDTKTRSLKLKRVPFKTLLQ